MQKYQFFCYLHHKSYLNLPKSEILHFLIRANASDFFIEYRSVTQGRYSINRRF